MQFSLWKQGSAHTCSFKSFLNFAFLVSDMLRRLLGTGIEEIE